MAVVKTRDGAGRWRGRGATAGPLAEPSHAAPGLLGGHATALAKAQGGREAQGPIRDVVATHRASRQVRPPSILTPPPLPPRGKALNPSPEQGPMFWPPAPKQRGRERMCVPDAAARLAPAGAAAGAAVGHVPVTYCLNQNRTHPRSGLAVLMRVQMAFEK